jgi:hypothetical protein
MWLVMLLAVIPDHEWTRLTSLRLAMIPVQRWPQGYLRHVTQ